METLRPPRLAGGRFSALKEEGTLHILPEGVGLPPVGGRGPSGTEEGRA